MKYILLTIALFAATLVINFYAYGQDTTNVNEMLKTGKDLIENGEYTKAVDYLGKIMTAVGDETTDPKITSFGATVQAYGLWKLNNPQMNSMAIHYLNIAITKDPSWEYPKKLLKEIEGNDLQALSKNKSIYSSYTKMSLSSLIKKDGANNK